MLDLTLSSPRFDDGGGQRDRTTGNLFIDLTLSSPKFDDGGMTEHRSKNTFGRSVPVKTKTDVEKDGTSEDGSPRPVCTYLLPCVDPRWLMHIQVGVSLLFCMPVILQLWRFV